MSDQRAESGDGGARLGRWRVALLCLCAVGLVVSIWRGPIGAVRGGSSDFAIFYTASRVWMQGGNPYDTDTVAAGWAKVVPGAVWPIRERGPVLLYPPAAFVLISPIAVLPFGAAALVWAALNTALMAAAVWSVARLAGLRGMAALAAVTGCVWLAPLASGVKYGQTAPLIVGLVAIGAVLRSRGRDGVGGVLQGMAAAIKPQLALLFVVYELGRGRWKVVSGAVLGGILLLAIGAGRMWAAGVPWWASWRDQLHDFQLIGDGNPTKSNHVRAQMINLHFPLHSVIESRVVVQGIVYGVLGAVCAAYLAVDWRRGGARGEGRGGVISLAMTAVVTLLVAYHRFYDAAILTFVVAAAVAVLSDGASGRGARRIAWAVLALLAVFVVPVTAQLLVLELHGVTVAGRHFELSPGVAQGWLWNIVIMPHETYAMLAIAVLLVGLRATVAHMDGVAGSRSAALRED